MNGQPLTKKTVLQHLDRLLLGSNNLFLFINPLVPHPAEGTPEDVDYDFAQSELAKASGFDLEGKDIDEQRRIEAVLEMLPMVAEVNAIAEELKKDVTFEIALVSSHLTDFNATQKPTTSVMVRVIEADTNNEWLIDRGDFVERRYEMQVRRLIRLIRAEKPRHASTLRHHTGSDFNSCLALCLKGSLRDMVLRARRLRPSVRPCC